MKNWTIGKKNRLNAGNDKLDKSILAFDLPAVKSCLNCSLCAKTCYARKSEKRFSAVVNWRNANFELAKHVPAILSVFLQNQLKRTKKRTVRIHTSGDFFSQNYLNLWAYIALKFPHIQFYGYTKVRGILDFTQLDKLPNVNIINSIMPAGESNFGEKIHVSQLVAKYNSFICPANSKDPAAPSCGNGCDYCFTKQNVVFYQH